MREYAIVIDDGQDKDGNDTDFFVVVHADTPVRAVELIGHTIDLKRVEAVLDVQDMAEIREASDTVRVMELRDLVQIMK